MKVPSELIDFIGRSDHFLVASHINPEGDAIGSSIALHLSLQSMGKTSTVFNRDSVPSLYRFLPQCRVVTDVPFKKIDNLILLDCNSLERSGLEKCEVGFSVVIDHHPRTSTYGDIQWILPEAPATGLMIYYLLKQMGISLSNEIATNLYTAIAIDTGIFRYSNTTAECMSAASELIQRGADPSYIAEKLFNNYSKGRFILLKETLNAIEVSDGIAVIVVTDDLYRSTGTSAEDTENFVNYPLVMSDVKISVLFRQLGENSWKISLRSKDPVDVSGVASRFNGGGHRNAAGCKIDAGFNDAKKQLLNRLKEIIH